MDHNVHAVNYTKSQTSHSKLCQCIHLIRPTMQDEGRLRREGEGDDEIPGAASGGFREARGDGEEAEGEARGGARRL